MRARLATLAALLAALTVAVPGAAAATARPEIAALQIALRAQQLYTGPVDGVAGPATVGAVRILQRRAGLAPTGRLDTLTRLALKRLGRPLVGRRVVGGQMIGWDVSVLEFLLAQRGFSPGLIDGRFDRDTRAAVRGFQRHAALPIDGAAGAATFRALRKVEPLRVRLALAWPVRGSVLRRFGLSDARLVPGVEIAAPYAAGVAASADGRVVSAGFEPGGLGLVVRLLHKDGVQTTYAHLARVDVKVGQEIVRGALIGLVGWTGDTENKPRLYLEVRVRGAAVDPLAVLR